MVKAYSLRLNENSHKEKGKIPQESSYSVRSRIYASDYANPNVFIFCFTMDPSGANLFLLEDMSTNF